MHPVLMCASGPKAACEADLLRTHCLDACAHEPDVLMGGAGKGLAVSSDGPGIFLQGLAVHGKDGRLLPGVARPCKHCA